MAKQNRSTLTGYFRDGTRPSEDHFENLVDSCLNTIDEGFDKSPENGFEVSLIGDHQRLISFFDSGAAKEAVWTIAYQKDHQRLLIEQPSADDKRPPALTFTGDGHIGVNNRNPDHALDVSGVVAAEGRLGANPGDDKTVPADRGWHDIAGPFSGCQAIEVMAGVGKKRSGKYALMRAVAMNTFNPWGRWFNFFGMKNRIKCQHSYYLSRCDRIELRWSDKSAKTGDSEDSKEVKVSNDAKGSPREYYLHMRTRSDYGDDVKIRFYLTHLWFDEKMSESWEQNGSDE
jgi:hypothetical protein